MPHQFPTARIKAGSGVNVTVGELDRQLRQIRGDIGERVVGLAPRVAGTAQLRLAGKATVVAFAHAAAPAAWREVKSRIRCQASVHSCSQSPKETSKNECGAPS
jgi:hypothetical protein